MSQLLSPQLSLEDDVGAVYLSRMDPEAGKDQQKTRNRQDSLQSLEGKRPTTTSTTGTMASTTTTTTTTSTTSSSAPPLPERNARRSSRFLDQLALGLAPPSTPVVSETPTQSLPPPHDVYLSSEEDASSAGDFSSESGDFDGIDDDDEYDDFLDEELEYEESNETDAKDASSTKANSTTTKSSSTSSKKRRHSDLPVRRHSHDTARVVSVVFAGKPSLVDLAVERENRRRSCEPTLHSRSSEGSVSSVSSVSVSTHSSHSSSSPMSVSARPRRPSTAVSTESSTVESSAPPQQSAGEEPPVPKATVVRTSTNMSFRERKSAQTAAAAAAAAANSPNHNAISVKAHPPAFLHLDPYANGSSYKTTTVTRIAEVPSQQAQTPTTATTQHGQQPSPGLQRSSTMSAHTSNSTHSPGNLLRGVTRTLTLSRRRSRPHLNDAHASPATPTTPATPTLRKEPSLLRRRSHASFMLDTRAATMPPPALTTPISVPVSAPAYQPAYQPAHQPAHQTVHQTAHQSTHQPHQQYNQYQQHSQHPQYQQHPQQSTAQQPYQQSQEHQHNVLHKQPQQPQQPQRQQPPALTYNEIVRSARRKSMTLGAMTSSYDAAPSPATPTSATASKRSSGFLGSLASRRRSVRVSSGRLLG